jgi:hypothetical protein
MRFTTLAVTAVLLIGLAGTRHHILSGDGVFAAQQVTRESREGIKNLARVETTVACAGAITTEAMPEIR